MYFFRFAFACRKLLVFAGIFIFYRGVAQPHTEHSFRSVFGPNFLVGYLSYVPSDYHSRPEKKFPLLIFLHGGGEKIWNPADLSNLHLVKKHGPPKLIEQDTTFPFIVISPQCPFGDWDMVTTDHGVTSELRPGEFVDEILEHIKKNYRIDTNRVYITGLSMGGAATWEYLQQHPEKVAAAIPVAGWGNGSMACSVAEENVAVWAFQREGDGKNNIDYLVEKINTCGKGPSEPAKATYFPGSWHDAWTETYHNTGPGIAPDNIYKWLMRQSKSKGPITSSQPEVTLELKDLNLYPVPAVETAVVSVASDSFTEAMIEIRDEVSVLKIHFTKVLNKGENQFSLPVKMLGPGIYTVSVITPAAKRTSKIVILKM